MQKGDYTQLATNKEVFPVPERPAAIGPTGGFGWLLELALGAPKSLRIMNTEILPDSPLALGIADPQSTSFTILQSSVRWCKPEEKFSCSEEFTAVDSIAAVRNGLGNSYYVDTSSRNILWLRVIQGPLDFNLLLKWRQAVC